MTYSMYTHADIVQTSTTLGGIWFSELILFYVYWFV